jgi:hypothetical protein
VDKSDVAVLRADLKDQIAEDRSAIREGLMDAVLAVGRADRERLSWIAKADRAELWRQDGHRNSAQFVSATFHVSNWKARRWIEASFALESLPLTAAALDSGALSLDKVCELTRFVTPADESRWIRWAAKATTGGVRAKADQEATRARDEAATVDATRYLTHSRWDDHIWIEARLPVDDGERVVKAIDDLAAQLPAHPDDEDSATRIGSDEPTIAQRRADALVALVTSSGAASSATTVVVHAPLASLVQDEGSASIDGGLTLHPETTRRLCCDSKIRTVVEDGHGGRLGIGDASRIVPAWLRAEVLERDGHRCAFPGCEHRRFLHMHHVIHWLFGGKTELWNLLALCPFHHKLIHEYRWSVSLDTSQRPIWFRPGGRVYEPGPAPPTEAPNLPKDPHRLAEAIGYSRMFGLAAVL